MKSLVQFALLLFLVICMAGCQSRKSVATGSETLPDGIYLILGKYIDKPNGDQVEGRLIKFSHHFLDENDKDQPHFLDVHPAEFVPLALSETPDSITQPDDRIHLMLTLAETSKKQLARFTGKHVDRHVAIVIGQEAMTMHKIRMKITGGKLQITRCTDNACEYLFYELQDNVILKKDG